MHRCLNLVWACESHWSVVMDKRRELKTVSHMSRHAFISMNIPSIISIPFVLTYIIYIPFNIWKATEIGKVWVLLLAYIWQTMSLTMTVIVEWESSRGNWLDKACTNCAPNDIDIESTYTNDILRGKCQQIYPYSNILWQPYLQLSSVHLYSNRGAHSHIVTCAKKRYNMVHG